MKVFKTVAGLRCYLKANYQDKIIGLVPTMGALHQGHRSLIKRAVLETDKVVVSIFINPLQFNISEDIKAYPRTLEEDIKICENLGVNVIFAPNFNELYPKNDDTISAENLTQITQVIPPQKMIKTLGGNSRPGHLKVLPLL